jgi:trans-aconitate 2-methyltransferase
MLRPAMGWDPRQYLKFADARLRPGFDLLAQIGELPAGPLYELGCGTGVHARAISARWPERRFTAIDNSAAMLAKAAAERSAIAWQEADIATWSAPEKAALIFSNATLQWLDSHERLFPHLIRQLVPGGVLAVQMPRNFDAPSHTLMRDIAAEGPWAKTLAPLFAAQTTGRRTSLLQRDPVRPPGFFYDLLKPMASSIDLWETEYLHQLQGEDAVLEWARGTALAPLLAALPENERAAYDAAFRAALRQAYPRRADGTTLYPFRRLFLVARA